jgi:hypothetical protein
MNMNQETKKSDCNGMKFLDLIKDYKFSIPSYQRAYSWTEKEVSLFIADLAEHAEYQTEYYLGHYIVESSQRGEHPLPVDIVDGQQRITTIAIFLAVCQHISQSSGQLLPLQLKVVEYDNDRFQEILRPGNLAALLTNHEAEHKENTASMDRVVKAIQTFHESFDKKNQKQALLSKNRIDDYINVISKAAISVGEYHDKAVASQIFELHNTRGVLLTETEKVKALLMKYVYLNSSKKNEDVDKIQKSFAEVFKLEEIAAEVSFRGEMSLDDILAHHLRAVDDGNKQALYTQPQGVEGENGCVTYVRKQLAECVNREKGVNYAKKLASELANTMHLVSNVFVKEDEKEPLIGDVILLDQRRSMIFLLRYFRALDNQSPSVDSKLLRRWESFLFLWDCHDAFWNMKSGTKDSFPAIYEAIENNHTQVVDLLKEYYSGKKSFAYRDFSLRRKNEHGEVTSITGLAEIFQDYITRLEIQLLHNAYNWGHWHGRYKYWLYKYEIENTVTSNRYQVRSSLRKLFRENDVTLDHIVPRELQWKELSKYEETGNDLEKWKPDDKTQAVETWKEICETINGIGNLVLLSRSVNASLQNMPPFKRASEYQKFELESISYKEVATWIAYTEWSNKIKERGSRLLTEMKIYFTDSDTWQE